MSTVSDVTCLGCGCLCDDLVITVSAGRILKTENACEIGQRWFLADDPTREGVPPAAIDGQPAPLEDALGRAAEILRQSQAPLILGLGKLSNEDVASALALADQIGATVDSTWSPGPEQVLRAIQRVGRVSATLGEVKHRADVVVFCGVDPVVTHPRHWERYSVAPRGRFVPNGRTDRHVLVIDTQRTATAEQADEFLEVPPDAWFETLWVLRGLVRGIPLDPKTVEARTSIDLNRLRDLAERLKQARYGAWFFDRRLAETGGGTAGVEAALALVRDLNDSTRFVILELGSAGNAAGASAVQAWQTGFALNVSLAQGFPQSIPAATSADALLARGGADAVLVVGENPPEDALSRWLASGSRPIPSIVIAPKAPVTALAATVALDSATPGIESGGTVTRSDGISLPLRPPLDRIRPSARKLLEDLGQHIRTS